ncbi:VOC family protein [Psychromicrobium lacuslunae]|uniref:VOC domain-containing protein n=1 Tax=Psychromicrobium lacuslunae TaxID=1618207 RepID=A0A0D4BYC1_9MICC|nr:VOC family protein [Psychromicrobium lacuslunae]AJT41086.1 hypothetical protein UM93_05345 [Psychromicrobium lacuslunae]
MSSKPQLSGLHHLKIPVSNLTESLRWYASVLGAERIPEFDHIGIDGETFAYITSIPGIPTLIELRLAPPLAQRMSGFDPIVFSVDTLESLCSWRDHLDNLAVANSAILRGIIGWLLVCHDPDGLSIRFHTNETHDFDADKADTQSPWVRGVGD